MKKSWRIWREIIELVLLVGLASVAAAQSPEAGPVQLHVIVTAEANGASVGGAARPASVSPGQAVTGASVRVGDVRKTTGENGDVTFTIDKRKRVRIIVSATDYQTAEKRADLTQSSPGEDIVCDATTCSVQVRLQRR